MYCVLTLHSETRGTHLYYQRTEYSVKIWGSAVKRCRWLSSFWETHSDYTIQNIRECKKESSQIVRHKKRVLAGWIFLLLFWGVLEMKNYVWVVESNEITDTLVYVAIYHWIKNGQ